MADVTRGGPGFVAVGRDAVVVGSDTYAVAAVWTSVDGVTWSKVAHDDTVFGRATGEQTDIFRMTAVTTGGPGLVAVGGRGGGSDHAIVSGAWIEFPVAAVWTSTDGFTWSRVPHDPAVFGDWSTKHILPMTSATMLDVTAGGPGLVAVGGVYRGVPGAGTSAAWTSADGITWSLATDQIEGSMSAVVAGGPGLVAVGSAVETPTPTPGSAEIVMAAVWTSIDGTNWTRVPSQPEVLGGPGYQAMYAVTTGGPGLVAVGDSGLDITAWTSVDGITWSVADTIVGTGNGNGNSIERVLRLYASGHP